MPLALNSWMIGGAWCAASIVLAVYMLWPSDAPPLRRQPDGLTLLVCGHLGIGGTLRVVIMLAAGMWWVTAAGLVSADAVRIALALGLGATGVVALSNAGRRASLSLSGGVVLSVALGGGVVGLLHLSLVGVRLVMGEGVM